MKRADKNGSLDAGPSDFEAFWKDFRSWSRFKDMEVDESLCRRLIEEQGDHRFQSIFTACLEAFRRKEDKARVGEKTPSHRLYIPTLFKWFPEARAVVIRRDPRAVVASQLKCPWVKITPSGIREGLLHESRWSQIQYYAEVWRQTYEVVVPRYGDDSRVSHLSYEMLVADTERTVRAVCGNIGEAFEPAMLERRGGAAKVAQHTAQSTNYRDDWSSWVKKHHAQTEKPINAASLDKWKRELSPLEIRVIEGICEVGMSEAGYAMQHSAVQRRLGRLTANALRGGVSLENDLRSLVRRLRKRYVR